MQNVTRHTAASRDETTPALVRSTLRAAAMRFGVEPLESRLLLSVSPVIDVSSLTPGSHAVDAIFAIKPAGVRTIIAKRPGKGKQK